MAESKIEWTDKTWNPTVGCKKVSPGCAHCYAEVMAKRLQAMRKPGYEDVVDGRGRWTGRINFVPGRLDEPATWKKPAMVFVNSMSDLFASPVDDANIALVFAAMYECQWHTFQVLTKRPERMSRLLSNPRFQHHVGAASYANLAARSPDKAAILSNDELVRDVMDSWPLPNVWLGTSVENQDTANERISLLAQTPAAVRFVSYEPALGPVDFAEAAMKSPITCKRPFDWLICGGESGHGARAMHPDWARQARDQCQMAGVAFFFKQWGDWSPLSTVDGRQLLPFGHYILPTKDHPGFGFSRVGKKKAGRILDGREWNEFPHKERN
jgi:protein gp37